MKFSALLLTALATSTSAFAPSRPAAVSKTLSAATLEAPTRPSADEADDVPPPLSEPVVTDMGVEKDWPVADGENFVKDSDRIEP